MSEKLKYGPFFTRSVAKTAVRVLTAGFVMAGCAAIARNQQENAIINDVLSQRPGIVISPDLQKFAFIERAPYANEIQTIQMVNNDEKKPLYTGNGIVNLRWINPQILQFEAKYTAYSNETSPDGVDPHGGMQMMPSTQEIGTFSLDISTGKMIP